MHLDGRWCSFSWPETKGISLEHMDRIFGEVDKVDAFAAEHDNYQER
jgi:hypothetical protein